MTPVIDLPAGLHRNVAASVYHTRELGVASKSALDELARSPAHYRTWLAGADESTPALGFGTAFHMALLEPERFASTYVAQPDFGDCRYKAAKDARDAWRAEHAGRTLIAEDDLEAIRGMAQAVLEHSRARTMVRGGERELVCRWTDEETGLQCKSRLDYYIERRSLAVDVKSCIDASADGFKRAITNYRYHVQDAFYRSGLEAVRAPVRHFAFIAVEKKPPYAVAVYVLDEEARAKGHARVRHDMATLAKCLKDDVWPGYPEEVQTIELPPWAA